MLDKSADVLYLPEDKHWAKQRYTWSSIEIPAADGALLLRNRQGALLGDQWAVKSFVPSSEEPSADWIRSS